MPTQVASSSSSSPPSAAAAAADKSRSGSVASVHNEPDESSKSEKLQAQRRANFWWWVWRVAAPLVVVTLITELISPTAYGRFGVSDSSTTFSVNPRLGWWLMELPCSVCFAVVFFRSPRAGEWVPRLFAGIMLLHYLYRGWIFPALLRVHGKSTNFSLLPALGGWVVTVTHGWLNAKWFGEVGTHLNSKWLRSWKFIVGFVLYYSGLALTIYHDHIMRTLRDGDGPRYRIPHGGLFEYATCAHYFSELWMWFGFMVLSWGPNGAFIFLVSLSNLVPRSVSTHEWYLSHFTGMDGTDLYPANRTQLVPFLW